MQTQPFKMIKWILYTAPKVSSQYRKNIDTLLLCEATLLLYLECIDIINHVLQQKMMKIIKRTRNRH